VVAVAQVHDANPPVSVSHSPGAERAYTASGFMLLALPHLNPTRQCPTPKTTTYPRNPSIRAEVARQSFARGKQWAAAGRGCCEAGSGVNGQAERRGYNKLRAGDLTHPPQHHSKPPPAVCMGSTGHHDVVKKKIETSSLTSSCTGRDGTHSERRLDVELRVQ
jgi:hypothetical protein